MPTVVQTRRDRTGSRFSDAWTITFDGVGDNWSTGRFKKRLRKCFVQNGPGKTKIRLGANQEGHPDISKPWDVTFEPGESRDFGNPASITVACEELGPDGTASVHVSAEWNR